MEARSAHSVQSAMSNANVSASADPDESETSDALAEGLIDLLRPAVEEIDERVRSVRQSQVDLRQHIDGLADDLKKISEAQPMNIDLENYVKKLNNSRRRVMLVNNILQNAQERLGKLHYNVSKETARRKALLDPPSPGPPQ